MTNQSDEKMGNTWLAAEMRSKSNLKPSLLNKSQIFRIFDSEVGNFWVFNIEGSTSGKRYRSEIIGVVEV